MTADNPLYNHRHKKTEPCVHRRKAQFSSIRKRFVWSYLGRTLSAWAHLLSSADTDGLKRQGA